MPLEPRLSASHEAPFGPPYVEVAELGTFGSMALLAMLQAGADPGFYHLRRLTGRGGRLAPHVDLRQRIVLALLETGVLIPAGPRRLRLDATLADSDWDRMDLEEADWAVRWSDTTRGSLALTLKGYLDELTPTPRNLEILLDAWFALAKAECLAFGAYALSSHRLDPAIAMTAEPSLGPILAQRSIGQGCALMWWAAKNVASSFLRHGGQPGLAEREIERTLASALDRDVRSGSTIPTFHRHHTQPVSTFAGAFLLASRLGESYWTSPIGMGPLEHARHAEHTS
ncbi:MAG: hypothetical protein JSS45_01355 [Proteobacteria bacterium]|nr:hypothetical protein [Pseudomonadota bacterium]MBS0598891.1 hypothetical protein [Pseudomonadota bacterium]